MDKQILDGFLKFSCGCQFSIKEDNSLDICLDIHQQNHSINFTCNETYKVLAEFSQGVFQLESSLGKSFCKKLMPENLEEIAALGAILRPSALDNRDTEGISTTQHYVNKKNGKEEIQSYHPIIDNILKDTYGEMIYQEQSLQIARKCAGFSLMEADILRRAIGHKEPETMVKCKILFLEKAKTFGVLSDQQAEEVFGWIEKSQRYSFNKCLSGDTIIDSPHGVRRKNIRDLYYGKRKNSIAYGISIIEDETLISNKILSINYAGHQECFRIITEDGCYVDLTGNHSLPTSIGKKLAHEIKTGDRLYTRLNNKLKTSQVEVLGIQSIGVKDTYDVMMNEPYHNLVVNKGIIVNNSHAVCYGITGYICAYIKTHFPLLFYTGWLKEEKDRSVYKELASEAKKFAGISVNVPNLLDMQEDFYFKKNNIYFGLANIKGMKDKDINKLEYMYDQGKFKDCSWTWFLTHVINNIDFGSAKVIIKSGALDFFKLDRQKLLSDLLAWRELNDGEQKHALEVQINDDDIISLYKELIVGRKFRKSKIGGRKERLTEILKGLENPAAPVLDTVDSIIYAEEDLLGFAISNHIVDNIPNAIETHTCEDISKGCKEYAVLKVKIDSSRSWEASNGTMMFVNFSDGSGSLENGVVFADSYEACKGLLSEGSLVFLSGKLETKNNRSSFIIKRVYNV